MPSDITDTPLPLSPELVKPAAAACGRAFIDDPTTAYFIPDTDKQPNLPYSFEYYLRLSLLSDGYEAYVTSPQCEGVAIWIRPDAKESPLAHLRAGWPALPLRCGWRHLYREAVADTRFGRLRRKLAPKQHIYLGLLAVDPAHHGKGFASKLIRPMLSKLDEEGLPAYVETQNERNVAMYGKWGFQLLKEETLANTDLKMFLLLRRPRIEDAAPGQQKSSPE